MCVSSRKSGRRGCSYVASPSVPHAEARHHFAGEVNGVLEIVLRARGGVAEHEPHGARRDCGEINGGIERDTANMDAENLFPAAHIGPVDHDLPNRASGPRAQAPTAANAARRALIRRCSIVCRGLTPQLVGMKRLDLHGDVVAKFAPQDMNVLIVLRRGTQPGGQPPWIR